MISSLDSGGEEEGFDPMGFSLAIDIRWLREAELKHGRVCMLATVGWIATDLGWGPNPSIGGLGPRPPSSGRRLPSHHYRGPRCHGEVRLHAPVAQSWLDDCQF